MFNRIIVGLDGSPASITAYRYAFELGKFYDIPVVGIYVVDVRLLEESFLADLAGVLGFTYYEGISAKVKDFLEKQGEIILEEFSALGRREGIKVSVVQTTGLPYREIAGQADEEDLILVGKVGRKPIKGVFLGSNAEKVLRHAKCPVFLTPERERNLKRALVAYDGSDSSRRALQICASWKGIFGYEVEVLFVKESEDDDAFRILSEAENFIGGDFTFHETTGFPEERIVEFVRERGVDVVFLGAYGKGRIKELFLGSITSFVIHHLDVPMLLGKSFSGTQ